MKSKMGKFTILMLIAVALMLSMAACSTPNGESADTQLAELPENQVITLPNAEVTLKGVVILDAVIDENMGLDARDDVDYLCAIYNVKNIVEDNSDVIPRTFIENTVIYNGKQEYKDDEMDIAGNGNSFTGDRAIPALQDMKLYSIFTIPTDISNDSDNIVLKTKIGNTTYQVTGDNVQNAVEFQKAITPNADTFAIGIRAFLRTFAYDVDSWKDAYATAQQTVDEAKGAVQGITPPRFYKEGFESYVSIVNEYDKMCSYVNAQKDSSQEVFATAMSESANNFKAKEVSEWIKQVKKNMTFLEETQFRN
ncbi:MAG: hypothetical protein RR131_09320, partial [Anaerovorax sp.]